MSGKFIALNPYIRKEAASQNNILNYHLNNPEKHQKKSKGSWMKESINIRAEANSTENRDAIEKNQWNRDW